MKIKKILFEVKVDKSAMGKIWWIWPLLFALNGLHATAQITALRCKKVPLTATPFAPDTLSLLPASLVISSSDTALKFHYNLNSNLLYFSGNFQSDSVSICYRVLPLLLSKPYFRRDATHYETSATYTENIKSHTPNETKTQFIATPGLNKTGSLTRGISLGNTQNVFVNSALNLQLEGQLAENLTLTAFISDQSIPYQPQGNTQQLREFDRVYVQLAGKKAKLLAGDIVLQNAPESHFLRFYKNVQGGQVIVNQADSNGLNQSKTSVAAAVSKGKFHTDSVAVQEGVQGPYRLKAPSNEIFIVILANSEKVYLDGRLLKRGFNFDYVIDYNQGEITFTNTLLITRFSRVRVDFEYAERNYNRTIFNASHQQNVGRLGFFLNWYQEADNPNRPLGFQLNSTTSALLSQIGDTLQKAVVSGATRQTEFSEGQVYYILQDTAASPDSIFKYTTRPQEGQPFFQVIFSDAGEGNGSYAIKSAVSNGRIYEWVGEGKGRYIPARQIVTPRKKAMTSFGGTYQLAKEVTAYGQMAFSQSDLNRYSQENADDDKGRAQKIGITLKNKHLSKKHKIAGDIFWEGLSANFNPIDRFRQVEFDRDWAANTSVEARATDNLFSAQASIEGVKHKKDLLKYSVLHRKKGTYVNGFQQNAALVIHRKYVLWKSSAFLLHNRLPTEIAQWRRFSLSPAYQNRRFTVGYAYSEDKNSNIISAKDSVISSAIYFDEHRFFVQSPDSQINTTFYSDYARRYDYQVYEGKMRKNVLSNTANLQMQLNSAKQNKLGIVFTYRELENLTIENKPKEQTLMSRIDWNGDYLKRHLRSEFTLTSATGRELKREFQFIKIATLGEGTHQWIDSNDDGIAQLEEFVEAQLLQDRQYIKVFVPTNEFVPAYQGKWVYRLNAEMPRHWRSAKGKWLPFLAKFSANTALTADRKITKGSVYQRFIPLISVTESQLLSTQQNWRNTLFFNRSSPAFGAELMHLQIAQKQLLTNGFDVRRSQEWRLLLRGNVRRYVNIQTAINQSIRRVASDFQALRNYTILQREIAPEISFQPDNTLRITALGSYSRKNNTQGLEVAKLRKIGLDIKWSKYSARTLQTSIKYIQINYNAAANTPLAYELLEALLPGRNMTWSCNWQQRLSNGLQLQVSYEGRRSQQQNTVHLGRMQLTALF